LHSLVFVILPSTGVQTYDEVYDEVARLLGGSERNPGKKFDFDRVACTCINWQASCDSSRRFDSSPEGRDFPQKLAQLRSAGNREAEEKLLAERFEIVLEFERGHPLRDKPDPDCKQCFGTGVDRVSQDPHGKWDYWSIGGRWEKNFEGIPTPLEAEGNLRDNVARARDIPADRSSYAIVTPDGDWVAGPILLGGRSMSSDADTRSEKEWSAFARVLLTRYAEHIVVAVDCHL
jgi:hypothetical protein